MVENVNNARYALHRQQRTLLLLLAALLIMVGVGLRSPWPPDEPRFVEVAREMVDSGHWLVPTRGAEYYPDKPPLYFWSLASAYALLGNIKFAFLLPSALSGLLILVLVYDLGRRLWQPATGLRAACLLLFSPQFLLQLKSAQIDAMLGFWVTAGCYGLLRHFLLGPQWRHYYAGCVAMGLGILTKGVGFLPFLLLVPLGLWVWQGGGRPMPGARDGRAGVIGEAASPWSPRLLAGPLLMLLVPAMWLVPMWIYTGQANDPALLLYRNNLLFHQTADRYVRSWHHIHPWYYFLVSVIPLRWFPMSLLAPALLLSRVRRRLLDRRILILFAWVALVILFFSISPGKRAVYLFPALPMLSLAMAAAWEQAGMPVWIERLTGGVAWLLVLLATVLAVGLFCDLLPVHHYESAKTDVAIALLLMAVAGGGLQWWLRKRGVWWRWAAQMCMFWLVGGLYLFPVMESFNTVDKVFAAATEKIGSDGELALVGFKESFLLEAPVNITHFGYLKPIATQEAAAWHWQAAAPSRYVLVYAGAALACYDVAQALDAGLALRKHWLLLPASARRPACAGAAQYPPDRLPVFHLQRR